MKNKAIKEVLQIIERYRITPTELGYTSMRVDRLLTVKDVAIRLNVNGRYVYDLIDEGYIGALDIAKDGNRSRYRISEKIYNDYCSQKEIPLS